MFSSTWVAALRITDGEGWPELYRFLDHPEVDLPFPPVNASYQRRLTHRVRRRLRRTMSLR